MCGLKRSCIIHLIRNTFRLTSRKYWDEIKRDIKPIYTAVNATAARAALYDLTEKWGQRHPAVIRLWGQRLGRVHSVPGLRRGDTPGDLQHQRDRVAQRPIPTGDQGPRSLPLRSVESGLSSSC